MFCDPCEKKDLLLVLYGKIINNMFTYKCLINELFFFSISYEI